MVSAVEKLIALASVVHVPAYTRISKTGKQVHVNGYTRIVKGDGGASSISPRMQAMWDNRVHERLAAPIGPDWNEAFRGGSAEKYLTKDATGDTVFTPERQKVHFEILNKVLGGHAPKETPTFTVLGGGPASGKSTIEIQHPEIRGDNAMVNPDDIKAMLPEHDKNDPKSAAFTHEESSYLSQKILEEGISRKIGLTLDGTGNSSANKVRSKFMPARRAGYKIGAYYVTIPTEEAVKRSMERAKKSGRMVPPDVIRQTHQRVSATFPLIMNEFDFGSLYDNSGPPGHALLVGSKRTGERFKVFDKPAWNRFLAKAGEM